jgi:8-oxo-dGTP pyrophosphatase MutT (NUDIX family)
MTTPGAAGSSARALRQDQGMRRLTSRVVYRNPWMEVREDTVRRQDGSTGTYGVVDKPDFALVLPRGEGGFWLVEQYRYPVGRRAWEFPQGSWPRGRDGDALDLARAELAEETGLRAAEWSRLGHLFAAYGFATQGFAVYMASGLTQGRPDREASERDMVHRFFPDAEVRAMVAGGELVDAPSVAALSLYLLGPGAAG